MKEQAASPAAPLSRRLSFRVLALLLGTSRCNHLTEFQSSLHASLYSGT